MDNSIYLFAAFSITWTIIFFTFSDSFGLKQPLMIK